MFQRTSDDSSINHPKWRIVWRDFKRPQTHSIYVTLLSDIIDADSSSYEEVAKKKGKESTGSRRMISRMWYLQVPSWNRWQHHGIQGNICSMRILTERRHRLRRDICSHWKYDTLEEISTQNGPPKKINKIIVKIIK